MATTSYGVNANEAVKLWSRKLFHEALKSTWAYKFMGEGSDSLCQVMTDTQKGPGDRVRVTLRMLLTGNGVIGDGTLEGNEEALTTYTDDIFIDQLRHAVRSGGKMSEQRIPFSVREEARVGLQDWWADRIDSWFMNQLAGSALQGDIKRTGLQAITQPSTNNILYGTDGNNTTEASINSVSAATANILSLPMIDELVLTAKTLSPQIRPIRMKGEDYWCLFVHPEQSYDLRTNSTTGQWLDIQKAAMQGGDVTNNPIFSGALGMYNNVIIHESTRVPRGGSTTGSGTQTSVRRAIFCGAQAAAVGFGRGYGASRMSWVEELFDYGNQLGVSAGLIGGLKKMRFNSQDFGTIVGVTGVQKPQ
jgi:N4-gp56 family major capsid protein